MLTASPYVRVVDDQSITIRVHDAVLRSRVISMGFACIDGSTDLLRCSAKTDIDRAALFNQLRAAGFAWSRGREWSPAEVFEHLRDQRILSGTFTSISWKSPDEWVLRDE